MPVDHRWGWGPQDAVVPRGAVLDLFTETRSTPWT